MPHSSPKKSSIFACVAVFVFTALVGGRAAVLTAEQDSYIRNGTNADNNFGASGPLQIANRSNADRKVYIGFDVSEILASGESFSAPTLNLTAYSAPLISTADGNVTFTIFGLTNNVAWDEGVITWNNSGVAAAGDPTGTVGNIVSGAGYNTGVFSGDPDEFPASPSPAVATPLGTITIDTDTLSAEDLITFSSSALASYLNWAAGSSSEYATLIITAQGTAAGSPGVQFYSSEAATAGFQPNLSYSVIPEPGAMGLFGTAGLAFFWRYGRGRKCQR